MLNELAQPHAPAVRADRDTPVGGHNEDREDLVEAGETAGVDLAEVVGARLKHLLVEDAVHAVLARRDPNVDGLADRGVTEDVVGVGGLLHPEDVELGQPADPVDCGRDVPDLVGVDHEPALGPDHLAGDPAAADVVVHIEADLQLDAVLPGVELLLNQAAHLLVRVPQPPGGRGVARVPVLLQVGDPLGAGGLHLPQQVDGLIAGDLVGEVGHVCGVDDLLGRHIRHEAPQRLVAQLRGQVPYGIHDRRHREVLGPLVRADPPQLGVGRELAVDPPEVRCDLLRVPADERLDPVVDRLCAHVVPATDCEGEAGAHEIRVVREQHDVCRGVVAVLVHRIGSVGVEGCRKAQVVRPVVGDRGHAVNSFVPCSMFWARGCAGTRRARGAAGVTQLPPSTETRIFMALPRRSSANAREVFSMGTTDVMSLATGTLRSRMSSAAVTMSSLW